MAKTVLDPADGNKAGLSPRPPRQRRQGGGLVDALSPQEWFQISSQFLNPQNNFGQAALQAGQGIQEGRRNAQMQEREEQLWQRQEQQFQREDQQVERQNAMREAVASVYEGEDPQLAAYIRESAPMDQIVQLSQRMNPEYRRQVEEASRLTEARIGLIGAQTRAQDASTAAASAPEVPGYRPPSRYTLNLGENGQMPLSYYAPSDPTSGQPYGVLPDGTVLEGDRLQAAMRLSAPESSRQNVVTQEAFTPDPVMQREYQRASAAAENFGSGLQMLTDILVNRDNPEVIPGLAGRARQVVQGVASQIGGILGNGTRLDENGVPTQIPADRIRTEGMTADSAEQEAENVLATARRLSSQVGGNDLPAGFRQTASDVGVYRSLLTSTAFQLALAQNGGRITEQDFRNAWNSLTSSDPATALQQFRAQAELTGNKIDAMHRSIFNDPEDNFEGYNPQAIAPTLYSYLGQMGTGGELGRQGVPGGQPSSQPQSGQGQRVRVRFEG
jgi:hypothetical protein